MSSGPLRLSIELHMFVMTRRTVLEAASTTQCQHITGKAALACKWSTSAMACMWDPAECQLRRRPAALIISDNGPPSREL